MVIFRRVPRAAVLAMALLAAAACTRREPAPVVFRGTEPGTAAPRPAVPPAGPVILPTAPVAGAPDANGVIDYGGYRAIVARPGDTVESLAARAGMSGSALAAYNGLPSGHVPRAGAELILPPDAGSAAAAAPRGAASVAAAPLAPPPGTAAAAPAAPAAPPPTAAAAPAAGSAPARAPGFDLQRIEQSLGQVQPATRAAPPPAAPAPAPATAAAASPAASAPAAAPPAAAPAQAATAPAATPERTATAPAAPAAASPAAPAPSRGARFVKPVSGEISRPFNRSGSGRSDGVDFAAPAGSEVKAAAPGQVALVSEALGGNLGTVVLIRHADQMLTVYGRVNSKVEQGQRVQAGQVIGTVAPAPGGGSPSLHFEVRRGTEPVDPAPFFGG